MGVGFWEFLGCVRRFLGGLVALDRTEENIAYLPTNLITSFLVGFVTLLMSGTQSYDCNRCEH